MADFRRLPSLLCDATIERGRGLMWVAGGRDVTRESQNSVCFVRAARGQASRRPEANKEPHDSFVSVFQVATREPFPAPRAHIRARRRGPQLPSWKDRVHCPVPGPVF